MLELFSRTKSQKKVTSLNIKSPEKRFNRYSRVLPQQATDKMLEGEWEEDRGDGIFCRINLVL